MQPRIIPRDEHGISRKLISPNALRTLYRLHDNGFIAYLVGGCVRDLLMGRTPKDFDIATDAVPGQIKRLFRNCRLIGRRFRLAHLHFQDEILEVSTFRASAPPEDRGDGRGGRRWPPAPPPQERGWDGPARQRLRNARGGRPPARLHDQRPGLQYRGFYGDRLHERLERPPAAAHPAHRRSVRPLHGRPGADDPRRSLRRVPRPHDRTGDLGDDLRALRHDYPRRAGEALRGDAEDLPPRLRPAGVHAHGDEAGSLPPSSPGSAGGSPGAAIAWRW